MQRLEPEKAERTRLAKLKALGRGTQKHRDWERQVVLLEKADEATRLEAFFEILVKRLDLPAAGMEAEDFAEWLEEHGQALSFLYREPPLPVKCGPSGALTRDIRRLTSSLVQSTVTLTPPDVTKQLRSEIERVPVEVARLRSARNWLLGWFVAYLHISVFFFTLLIVCCLDLSGLIHPGRPRPSQTGPGVGETTIEALVFAAGAFGTLSIATLLGRRWKRKAAEFQERQRELQERRATLEQEAARLQAEVSQRYQLLMLEASKARERLLHEVVRAVANWRSTVRSKLVEDFFEQGLWINDRFAERLKALLATIQRPFPTACRVETDCLRDDQIEEAFRVLTAVIASTIADKLDLGRSSTLAQLIVSGSEPGVPMPAAAVVLERLETEGVLLTGDQLCNDTKSCMTEVLEILRS
jgi:hypothetical protein